MSWRNLFKCWVFVATVMSQEAAMTKATTCEGEIHPNIFDSMVNFVHHGFEKITGIGVFRSI